MLTVKNDTQPFDKTILNNHLLHLHTTAIKYYHNLSRIYVPGQSAILPDLRDCITDFDSYMAMISYIANALESSGGIDCIYEAFKTEYPHVSSSDYMLPFNVKIKFLTDMSMSSCSSNWFLTPLKTFFKFKLEHKLVQTVYTWYFYQEFLDICKKLNDDNDQAKLIEGEPSSKNVTNFLIIMGYTLAFHILNSCEHISPAVLSKVDVITPLISIGTNHFASPSTKNIEFIRVLSVLVVCSMCVPAMRDTLVQLLSTTNSSPTRAAKTHTMVGNWRNLFNAYTEITPTPTPTFSVPFVPTCQKLGILQCYRRLRAVAASPYMAPRNNGPTSKESMGEVQTQLKEVFHDVAISKFIPAAVDTFLAAHKQCEKLNNIYHFYRQGSIRDLDQTLSDLIKGSCDSVFRDSCTVLLANDEIINHLEKSASSLSDDATKESSSYFFSILLQNHLKYFCDLGLSNTCKRASQLLSIPPQFYSPTSAFACIDIIFEAIDSKCEMLRDPNSAQLFGLAVKHLEMNSHTASFASDAVFKLQRMKCPLSAISLWSHLTHFVASFLTTELFHVKPIDIIDQEFTRLTPPFFIRPFELLNEYSRNSNPVIARLQVLDDLYQAVPFLIMILRESLPSSLINQSSDESSNAVQIFINRSEPNTILNSLFSVLYLGTFKNDKHLNSIVMRFMTDVATLYSPYGDKILLRLAKSIKKHSIVMASHCETLIRYLAQYPDNDEETVIGFRIGSLETENEEHERWYTLSSYSHMEELIEQLMKESNNIGIGIERVTDNKANDLRQRN